MSGKILWFGMLIIYVFGYKAEAQVREYLICPNDTFSYPDINDGAYYWIDFGDGTKDSGYYPVKHMFAKQGKFKMNISRTLNSKTDRIELMANVGPLPKPAFLAESRCYLYNFKNQMPDTIVVNGGWKWDFGDGNTSNETSISHLFQSESTYKVSLGYARKNSCSSSTKKEVSVSSGIYPGFDVHANQNEAIFIPLDTSEVYYHWDFTNHDTTDSITPIHSFNKSGTYPINLTIRTANGCETFYSDTITVTSAGIEPLFANANLFAAYPNPFKNNLLIHYEIIGTKKVILNLYDANGKLAANIFTGNQRTGRYDIHIDPVKYGLTRGLYLLNAYFNEEYFSQKLIME